MHNIPSHNPLSSHRLANWGAPYAEIKGGTSDAMMKKLKGMPGVPSIDVLLQYTFASADCLLPPYTENLAAEMCTGGYSKGNGDITQKNPHF